MFGERSIKLFSVFGIRVGANPSWFIFLFLMIYWLSGYFSDILIGFWSGLDIMVDPYTGSASGTVRVVAMQDYDVAIRHPESICKLS